MSEAICDTSPVQYLHQLGLLGLLPRLFRTVVIPQAVLEELAEGRRRGIALPDPGELSWAETTKVSVPPVIRVVADLGAGECEVLALAMERGHSTAILDDLLAREVAAFLGVSHTGTLGVLIQAKRAGYVDAVTPLLERLEKLSFRCDARTRELVLKKAGETSPKP